MKARNLKSMQARTLKYVGTTIKGGQLVVRARMGTTILEAPVSIAQAHALSVARTQCKADTLDAAIARCYPSLH